MNSFSKKISKTIRSQTEQLIEAREFVSEAAREFGFADEDVANIALAVDEACTNIIKHAYQYARDKEIQISVLRNKETFEILIADEGKSFNPGDVRPPNLKQHLGQYRKGGLGVYLMKRLMDKVEYSFIPGRKNEVRLTKVLSHTPTVARR